MKLILGFRISIVGREGDVYEAPKLELVTVAHATIRLPFACTLDDLYNSMAVLSLTHLVRTSGSTS
eukprot:gene24879-10778_t